MPWFPGTDAPDSLWGSDEDDLLEGGAGGDTLVGGLGRDGLSGDQGDDILRPGPGRDHIDFEPSGDHDTVDGFVSGEDTLVFSGFGAIRTADDLMPFVIVRDNMTVIDVAAAEGAKPGSQSVTLIRTGEIAADDLAFNIGIVPMELTLPVFIEPHDF